MERGTVRVKRGLAEMLKGGVIMDVTNAEQAKIAETAGAVSVMALERVPADIRAEGGVARMADLRKIEEIVGAVTIPVMAKVADRTLRRGAGPPVDRRRLHRRVRGPHARRRGAPHRQVGVHRPVRVRSDRPRRSAAPHLRGRRDDPDEGRSRHRQRRRGRPSHALGVRRDPPAHDVCVPRSCRGAAKELRAPLDLVQEVAGTGKLPVVNFAAGGLATPADAALMMQLGCEGVFVGSGIFKSEDPETRARAIVEATTYFEDPDAVARATRMLPATPWWGPRSRRSRRGWPTAAGRLTHDGRRPRAPG